ncbi:MAG: hypothetical protein AAF799_31820 [Myxococcota bacterium]
MSSSPFVMPLWAVLAGPAAAEPRSEPELHDVAHAEHDVGCPLHWHNLVGLKAIGVVAVEHGEPSHVEGQGGVGLFYERTLVRGWLELELSANVLITDERRSAHVPLDVLFKKPFHVSHVFDPYVGAGAAFTFGVGEDDFFAVGALGTAGSYLWLHPRVGVLAEVDYTALPEPHGWQHEIELSTGPLFRF